MVESNGSLKLYPEKSKVRRGLNKRVLILLPFSLAMGAALGFVFALLPPMHFSSAPPNPLRSAVCLCALYGTLIFLAWAFMLIRTWLSSRPSVILTRQGLSLDLPFQRGFLYWNEIESVSIRRWLSQEYVALVPRTEKVLNRFSPAAVRHLAAFMYSLPSVLPQGFRRRRLELYETLWSVWIPEEQLPISAEELLGRVTAYQASTQETGA